MIKTIWKKVADQIKKDITRSNEIIKNLIEKEICKKEIKEKIRQERAIQEEKLKEQTEKLKTKTEKLLNKELNIQTFFTVVIVIGAFVLVERVSFLWHKEFDISSIFRGLGTVIPICLGMSMSNYFLNKRNKKRIILLSNGLREAAKGNFDIQLNMRKAGALFIAYDDFNKMCRELKKVNENMLIAVEDAKAANEAKSNFLSNISHEIRTPINAVLGFDEMIIRESGEEEIRDYAFNIRNAGKSLLGLINDLLDFSKIESGKMEIIPVEYDLSSLMNDLLNMISIRAEEKGLELKVMVEDSLPHILYGDEIRVKQVLLNVLTNAVKYTEKGSVFLSISGKKAGENQIALRFQVKDTGIGIKEEDIEKLFSMFERIEEERNRTIEGTGLGLNITKQLLSLMDSKLEVKSRYGEGSEFSFTILQKVVDWRKIGNFVEHYCEVREKEKEYKETFIAPKAKILVVDDTIMNLTVIKGLLKQTKIQIDTAESGKECLSLVTQKEYHAIFLDHRMPEMDGIETLHCLMKLDESINKNTPVIALTANALSGARMKYIKEGFSDYLSKPVDTIKLEKLLLNYLPPELVETTTYMTEDTVLEKPDWKIKGLVINKGIDACGSMETFEKVLKEFYITMESKVSEIKTYFERKDYHNYIIKVHALKSSARLIGAIDLSELAGYLEECGNNGNIEEVNHKTEKLIRDYYNLAKEIAPYVERKKEKDDRPVIEWESLQEALSTLCEFVEAFDFESADSVMEMLEDYSFPAEARDNMKQLKILMANVDRDTIISFIKSM